LRGKQAVERSAEQLVAAVAHFGEKGFVRVLDASLRVHFEDHHLAVQRVLDLSADRGFLAKRRQLPLELVVEHFLGIQ